MATNKTTAREISSGHPVVTIGGKTLPHAAAKRLLGAIEALAAKDLAELLASKVATAPVASKVASAPEAPSKEGKRPLLRYSGRVAGRVRYVRSAGAFEVTLVDQQTGESTVVNVPAEVDINAISATDRTVAFRRAIRKVRWAWRTKRRGKRVLVRQLLSFHKLTFGFSE